MFSAVEIEINSACNRRCSYCPNSVSKRKDSGEIDPALYRKLMTELRELGYSGRISPQFYGEPLLHRGLEKLLAFARESLPCSPIELYTNGTLLDRERFVKLLEAGVTRFIVTRHENERDYLFEKTYAVLSELERSRVLFREFESITLTNRGGLLKHLPCPSDLAQAPCLIPSSMLTVTVSGNVLPCFEDYEEQLVMGNLNSQRLIDIWNSDRYVRFRNQLKLGFRQQYGPCSGCSRRAVLPAIE